jgi:hypothetical protein
MERPRKIAWLSSKARYQFNEIDVQDSFVTEWIQAWVIFANSTCRSSCISIQEVSVLQSVFVFGQHRASLSNMIPKLFKSILWTQCGFSVYWRKLRKFWIFFWSCQGQAGHDSFELIVSATSITVLMTSILEADIIVDQSVEWEKAFKPVAEGDCYHRCPHCTREKRREHCWSWESTWCSPGFGSQLQNSWKSYIYQISGNLYIPIFWLMMLMDQFWWSKKRRISFRSFKSWSMTVV